MVREVRSQDEDGDTDFIMNSAVSTESMDMVEEVCFKDDIIDVDNKKHSLQLNN